MATPESIAIRRSDALTRVERALGRIGEQAGIEIAPYPEPHKRPEVRPAIEAEWLADALEAVAGAATPEHTSDGNPESATDDSANDSEQPTDDAEDDSDNAKELDKLTRAELDVYANHLGIENADKLPNKDAVLAAIKAAS